MSCFAGLSVVIGGGCDQGAENRCPRVMCSGNGMLPSLRIKRAGVGRCTRWHGITGSAGYSNRGIG
ncbi:hypothetical protein, partial [Thalassospira sp. UBA1131]|uniref:hypothetical protein n=1 Tax=Thalassospira sp. UBA1131 TaxID=1947672 RepID=UPI0025D0BA72